MVDPFRRPGDEFLNEPPEGFSDLDAAAGDDMPERLAQAEIDLAAQHEVLQELVDQISALVDEDTGQAKAKPWCYHPPPEVPEGEDELTVWVSWFNENYDPTQKKNRIPECWALHGGLAAEIATLYHSWRRAFLHPKARPDDAQQWHDRWLPGFLHRMDTWCTDECRRGAHRDRNVSTR